MPIRDETELLENVRIVYKNFAGKEGTFNRAGDRNFSIVLDTPTAERLKADGWNIKSKPGREEGEEDFHTIPVTIQTKGRLPRLVMVTRKGRTTLTEDLYDMLDWAELDTIDIIIRPYDWDVSGKTGRKAYLKTMFAWLAEDALEIKYADIPEIEPARAALPAGTGDDEDDVLDVESWETKELT